MRELARCALAAILAAPLSHASPQSAEEHFAEARKALEAGRFGLVEEPALAGLARSPYARDGYRILYELGRERGDAGAHVRWGRWLYWSLVAEGEKRESAQLVKEFEGSVGEWNAEEELLEDWREAALRAVDTCTGRAKQYVAAARILQHLSDWDPNHDAVAKEQRKLASKMASWSGARARSLEWIAREDARHTEWKNAYKAKTDHFIVETTLSYTFHQNLCAALEAVYAEFAEAFGLKKSLPTIEIQVHRNQPEYDRAAQQVRGFAGGFGWYNVKEMVVSVLDRTGRGEDPSFVYKVLFHELSRLILDYLTTSRHGQTPPAWLNEGLAGYFQGFEVRADGRLVRGKPLTHHLAKMESLRESGKGHTLEELILTPETSYDETHDPFAWSLVYFLNHYEDESGELVYRDLFRDYVKSFTKKGDKDEHERLAQALARAEEMFVEDAEHPAVSDLDGLEQLWKDHSKALHQRALVGAEAVDGLLATARTQIEQGNHERALLAVEQAYDWRPDRLECLWILAEADEGLGRSDRAVAWMLRHWEEAWSRGAEEASLLSEEWLVAHGAEGIVEDYCTPARDLLAATRKLAGELEEAGRPEIAALACEHVLTALGLPHVELLERLRKLREDHGVDHRLWIYPFTEDTEGRKWNGYDLVRHDPEGVLINHPPEVDWPMVAPNLDHLASLQGDFELAGTVQVDGELGAFTFFGIDDSDRPRACIWFVGETNLELHDLDWRYTAEDGWDPQYTRRAALTVDPVKEFEFEFSSGPDGKLSCGGKSIPVPPDWSERLRGGLAFSTGEDVVALYSDLRIRTERPFWPARYEEEE